MHFEECEDQEQAKSYLDSGEDMGAMYAICILNDGKIEIFHPETVDLKECRTILKSLKLKYHE